MGYYGWYFDPTYILVVLGMILCMIASSRVKSTFQRYNEIRSMSGMTGAQAAQRLLQYKGLNDVRLEHVNGSLTDHYDIRSRVVRLSSTTYGSDSVAAIGVAAHETGHAVQNAEGYVPLKIRDSLLPVANVASYACWPILILGLFFNRSVGNVMIEIGIWLFLAVVLFQLVTLPLEFNASHRGLQMLEETGILNEDEIPMARRVLKAAAMTYVAAAAAAILQFLRILLLFGGRNRD